MARSVVSQILSVAQQVGEIVSGRQVEPNLQGAVNLGRLPRPKVEHSPSLGVRSDAEARGHDLMIARREPSPETVFGPWRIWFDPPPIGARNCDWHYQHEDADGESPGWMYGHCASRDDCLEEIITHYEERVS